MGQLALQKAAGKGVLKVALQVPEKWEPMKGGLPLAALIGGMLLYKGMKGSVDQGLDEAKDRHNMKRLGEAQRNSGTIAALRGGAPLDPMGNLLYQNERADSAIPGDVELFSKGAAAHAEAIGRLLAKTAGIGGAVMKGLGAINNSPDLLVRGAQAAAKPIVSRLPGPSLGTKALIGATALGGGLLAAKAGKKALEFGMEPAQERRLGGPHAGLPRYVNQFGVPTMG
jgi:hypothetical protein